MVKILPALLGLSASLAVVFGHAGHSKFGSLEKRGTTAPEPTGCKTAYTPVAAGSYPALDCIPFVEDPQVQTWLKQYDISKTPVFPLSNDGLCPTNTASIPAGQCWWTCQKCTAPGDVTYCPKPGTWGLTYDGMMIPSSLLLLCANIYVQRTCSRALLRLGTTFVVVCFYNLHTTVKARTSPSFNIAQKKNTHTIKTKNSPENSDG